MLIKNTHKNKKNKASILKTKTHNERKKKEQDQ
jgi:hypothetical protein